MRRLLATLIILALLSGCRLQEPRTGKGTPYPCGVDGMRCDSGDPALPCCDPGFECFGTDDCVSTGPDPGGLPPLGRREHRRRHAPI